MKRNRMLGIAAGVAIAAGALVAIPSTAQASAACYYTAGHADWVTRATVGTIKPCAEVQARISVINNYGLAGTWVAAASPSVSSVTAPQSGAPGTYTTHSFRYKPKGGSWSAWLPC